MRRPRFEIVFSLLLAAFTVYALLDTFVIPRQYESVENAAAQEWREIQPSADTATEKLKEIQPSADTAAEELTEIQPSAPQENGDTTRRRKRGKSGAGGKTAAVTDTDDASRKAAETTDGASRTADASATEILGAWSDENVSVTVTQYRAYDTDIYVADVTLSAPEFLKTAFAGNAYGRNIKEKTSVMASENNAILAINGDYYGARERGYVIRNGVLYRETPAGGDVLAIMADGSFQIADDRTVTAKELLDAGAVQALSFGPALLKDGVIAVTEGQEVGKAMASNPRTAVGVLGDLHYLFVVADGRTEQSAGMSLHELAEFLQRLGADTAYNLDGGGSSAMVFDGEIVNRPTTSGNSVKERSVSDIVYIAR